MVYSDQIKISHPDVEKPGYVTEESLEVWLELGWTVVSPEAEAGEPAPTFVVHIDAEGDETMISSEGETPLPDEKESDQDDTADPKEF